jgi:hypothetical protein
MSDFYRDLAEQLVALADSVDAETQGIQLMERAIGGRPEAAQMTLTTMIAEGYILLRNFGNGKFKWDVPTDEERRAMPKLEVVL